MFRHNSMENNEYKSTEAPLMPRSGESITSAITNSCSSSSDERVEFHSSFVSAITMDDTLGNSDRFGGSDSLGNSDRCTGSDRYQYRLDPRLHALWEQKRASDLLDAEEVQQFLDDELPATNYNRFSNASEGADTNPCPVPRRQPSYADLGGSSHHKSASNSLDYLGSGHRKSSVRDLDYRGSGHRKSSSHHKLSSSLDDYRGSAHSSSSDLDYRSEQWGEQSFFLEEENLDNVEEASDESCSSHDPLHGDLDAIAHVGYPQAEGNDEPQTNYIPSRSYHKNVGGYSGSGLSSKSLDLFDVFEDPSRSH